MTLHILIEEKWNKLKDRGEIYIAVFIAFSGAAGATLTASLIIGFFTDFKGRRQERVFTFDLVQ